jgi:hypothetical protein
MGNDIGAISKADESVVALESQKAGFLRRAKKVFVNVNGTDDMFYVAVSKVNARLLLKDAGEQLQLALYRGDAYIERSDLPKGQR